MSTLPTDAQTQLFKQIELGLATQSAAAPVSADYPNPAKTAIFYSGKVNEQVSTRDQATECREANPNAYYRIDDTQAGQYLNDKANSAFAKGLITKEQWDDLWLEGSRMYASAATPGNIIVYANNAGVDRVFAKAEWPIISTRLDILSINGMPKIEYMINAGPNGEATPKLLDQLSTLSKSCDPSDVKSTASAPASNPQQQEDPLPIKSATQSKAGPATEGTVDETATAVLAGLAAVSLGARAFQSVAAAAGTPNAAAAAARAAVINNVPKVAAAVSAALASQLSALANASGNTFKAHADAVEGKNTNPSVEMHNSSGKLINNTSFSTSGTTLYTRALDFDPSSGKLIKVGITKSNLDTDQTSTNTTILDGNQSSAGGTVGNDQFKTDADNNTLQKIAKVSGVLLSELQAKNPTLTTVQTLPPGTTVNLPAPDNTRMPTWTGVTGTVAPQKDTKNENDATNNVNAGIIESSSLVSVSFPTGFLNLTDFISATEAGLATGGIRPGAIQINPNIAIAETMVKITFPSGNVQTGGMITSNLAANGFDYSFLDPLLLDLNGQGVQASSVNSNPVFFDVDHSGTLKQSAWTPDGNTGLLVVPDSTGQVANMSQVISEYYGGTAGTGGSEGSKPYVNGMDALGSFDSNNDGKVTSADTQWSTLRVWQDTNHNAKVDFGELKTLAQLAITQFSLTSSNFNATLNGNPVTAVSSFVMNSQSRTMADINLIHNDASHTLTTSGTGQIDTAVNKNSDGTTTTTKTFIDSSSTGTTYNASALHVNNVTGGSGNDYLLGTSTGSWLQGNGGSNTYMGGAGNDVFIVSASDDPANINGNGGQDELVITGTDGMTINMAQSQLTIAEGGAGDDVIMSGGRDGVYIKGGTGEDLLIGGAGDDVIVGGTGHNTIVGGTAKAIIYAGPNGDLIYGAAQSSIINAGGGEDTIIGGAGNDLIKVGMGNAQIDGRAGTNTLQFHGSYGDYKIVKTADGYVISDRIPNRDGTVFAKNIQQLSFSDFQGVSLSATSPMPVADILTKDKNGILFDHTQSHTISAAALVSNDQLLSSTGQLSITALKDVVGGTATINSSGDVVFTPTAGYDGMMSFKYTVSDAQGHPAGTVVDYNSGQTAPMYARVTLATPDLPTDPLVAQEWYLNDANIIPVWDDYTGAGVRIGEFEAGGTFELEPEIFNYNHPDLTSNIDPAWLDSQKLLATLPTSFSEHATFVAGVMVAAKNGTGAVGVAYDAQLGGFNIGTDLQGEYLHTAAYDVANNSWYSPNNDFTVTNLDPQTSTSVSDVVLAEQQYAISYGRGGKGTVIVGIAGNDRQTGGSAQGTYTNNSRYAIEVGAINQQADLSTLASAKTPFSNPGASILVSAPGSNIVNSSQLVVTDQGSIYGSNYTTAEGTSFAAPIVSGIAALMLQANPNLGYRDVQSILALSAKKIADPATSWNYNHSTNWNGSGMHESYDYGFGEVDALAAVRLAETWTLHNTTSNEDVRSGSKSVPVTVSAGSSASQTITMAAGVSVEHVEIDISLSSTIDLSKLTITLTSPTGTQSILLNNNDPGVVVNNLLRYTFMSTQEWGETSIGAWTLQVQDTSTNQPVTLNAWNLRLYGSTDTADDTYYYTNEYSAQVTRVASAATLNDAINGTAGGKNTINAAAVTGNTSINLLTGTASIGGTGLTISNPTSFNNVFTGDGDDTLTANNNLGILDGGRGTNTLTGGTGQNLFVVQERTNGLDTIYNFNASNDKIDLVGFIGKSYSNLSITQQGADTWISLNGQKIVLKNTTAGSVASSSILFQNAFVAPAIYTDSSSTDNTFFGATNTVNLQGGFAGISTNQSTGKVTFSTVNSPINQHDAATSDRFVVTSSSIASGAIDAIQGFKPGIDKIDLSSIGIANINDLIAASVGTAHVTTDIGGTLTLGNGIYIGSYSLNANFLYLDSLDITQLSASDFIFSNGLAGDPSTKIPTSDSFVPNNHVPLNTTGNSDPNVIGSNNGVTFNGTTSITSSVNYTLPDTVNNLILTGTKNLAGVANNNGDTISSNTGIDTLIGGTGSDTYIINNSNDQITEQQFGGNDSVQSSVSYWLDDNIENLTLTGSDDINGTGNTLSNTMNGNSGDNILDGLAGADTIDAGAGDDTLIGNAGNDSLIGGTGDDTYVYSSGWGSDTISDASGNNTLDLSANSSSLQINLTATSSDHTNSASSDIFWTGEIIQNVYKGIGNDSITGTSADNYINGGAGNDTITSAAGNDTLDGDAGNDTLIGGTGDDLYIVDSTTDTVTENTSEGTDTVQSTASFTLSANVENLTLTGSDDLSASGNSGANIITGNSGNDTLFGASGNDSLIGGTGDDSYLYTAGWGSDTISDAGGNNTLDFSNYNSSLQINLTATTDDHTNSASSDLFWSGGIFQNILKGVGDDVLTGTSVNNNLSGGGGNDTINAGAGNDTLDGGAGNDSLVGGTGNDLYIVDATVDIVVENAIEGNDTVQSSATYTLSSNVENLTLTGSSAISGSGNASDNIVLGNSGANTLSGQAGNDSLDGGTGADTLKGGTGNDTYLFSLGDGVDSVQEADNTAGNSDTLSFDASVIKANIAIFMSGNDLQIGYKNNATDQITVVNQQLASGSIERFQANDGTFLTNADVNSVIQAMGSYATSNGISFTSLSDVENNTNLMAIVNGAWHAA